MRQTELNLSEEDRSVIDGIRGKGLHQAREVNRAHVLSCLESGTIRGLKPIPCNLPSAVSTEITFGQDFGNVFIQLSGSTTPNIGGSITAVSDKRQVD
jgi:hypothetical protein